MVLKFLHCRPTRKKPVGDAWSKNGRVALAHVKRLTRLVNGRWACEVKREPPLQTEVVYVRWRGPASEGQSYCWRVLAPLSGRPPGELRVELVAGADAR